MSTETQHAPLPKMLLPLADIEQRVGSQVWIILRGEKEFTGTLVSYDEFINLVLNDVTEFDIGLDGTITQSHLPTVFLNGSQICMIVSGGKGPIETIPVKA